MPRRRRKGSIVNNQPLTLGPRSRRRNVLGVRNWLVSSSAVDNTGAPVTTGPQSWGISVGAQTCVAGSNVTSQLTIIQPAPATTTPSVGRQRIDQIKGKVYISAAFDKTGGIPSPGYYSLALGIYVSELNSTTTKWNVRQPTLIIEAERDDYVYLEGKLFNLANNQSAVLPDVECPHFDIDMACNIEIGGGEALHLTVANDALSKGDVQIYSYVRVLIGPVA